MKKIGLLGGISHKTTIQYYELIMKKYYSLMNDINYPEMIIYSLSHGLFKNYENEENISNYINYIQKGIGYLEVSGAEIIAFAANSPHKVIEKIKPQVSVPIISALDSAVRGAKQLKIKKGLLLGIKFTMQSGFFQERFNEDNIQLLTPTGREQDVIDDIISNELNFDIVKDSSIKKVLNIINSYSVDGVIIGCMRLPVLLNSETFDGIFVNTLDLHITDIVNYALPV